GKWLAISSDRNGAVGARPIDIPPFLCRFSEPSHRTGAKGSGAARASDVAGCKTQIWQAGRNPTVCCACALVCFLTLGLDQRGHLLSKLVLAPPSHELRDRHFC